MDKRVNDKRSKGQEDRFNCPIVVQDSAQAVLGDVSISGDVHVHVHSQLDEVATASTVFRLIHIANVLLRVEKDLLFDEPATSRVAQILANALLQLEQTQSQLSVCRAALTTTRCTWTGQHVSTFYIKQNRESRSVGIDIYSTWMRSYRIASEMLQTWS